MEHRAVRLLSRRYVLTATGYKYLEIGINVGPPNYMEIALGDHRGHELSLSKRGRASTSSNLRCCEMKNNFISIGPLTVSVCTLMLRSYVSILHPYALRWPKRHMYRRNEWLARFVDTVDVKYMRFSNIASENTIHFRHFQLIDCELLALVFNTYKKETM